VSTDHNISASPQIEDLISLRQASELSGLTTNHLRLLVGHGKLWGMKIGSFWVTTEEAIKEYLSQGNRPGPKPK